MLKPEQCEVGKRVLAILGDGLHEVVLTAEPKQWCKDGDWTVEGEIVSEDPCQERGLFMWHLHRLYEVPRMHNADSTIRLDLPSNVGTCPVCNGEHLYLEKRRGVSTNAKLRCADCGAFSIHWPRHAELIVTVREWIQGILEDGSTPYYGSYKPAVEKFVAAAENSP